MRKRRRRSDLGVELAKTTLLQALWGLLHCWASVVLLWSCLSLSWHAEV